MFAYLHVLGQLALQSTKHEAEQLCKCLGKNLIDVQGERDVREDDSNMRHLTIWMEEPE